MPPNAQEKEEILQHFGPEQKVHIAANLAAAPQALLSLPARNEILKLSTVARVSEEKNLLGGLQFLIDSNVKTEWNIYWCHSKSGICGFTHQLG